MEVLEDHMSRSLHSVVDAVEMELNDARYKFKVDYNDRRISPESYVAETIDTFKHRFKEFQTKFQKPQVRQYIREMLQARILDICLDNYWNDVRIPFLPHECGDSVYWDNKMEVSSSALTKMGIGKLAVQLVVDLLTENMNQITKDPPWNYHEKAAQQILAFSHDILRSRFHSSVDQVENTIKPFKFEVESTELEWKSAQVLASQLLSEQFNKTNDELSNIKSTVGRRKLRLAARRIQNIEAGKAKEEDYPTEHLESARNALALSKSLKYTQSRMSALKSSQCSISNPTCCPEIQLLVISEKLSNQAMLFIQIELLNEFFFQLPRDVDESMYYSLSRPRIMEFAKENPAVRQHLEVQGRKVTLESVLDKLKNLRRNQE